MKILFASPIWPEAIAHLEQEHDVVRAFGAPPAELARHIVDADILVFRSGVQITAEVLSAAQRLKRILRAGSGVDNIDMAYVRAHDLPLVRVPGPGAKAVAELAFAMMLLLAREVLVADRALRDGRWTKKQRIGRLLTGKTLGVIGLGNIGSRVAKLGQAWDMKVIGCVEFPTLEREAEFAGAGMTLTDLDGVLAAADFVSIHVPLQASTKPLIEARELALMKPSAYLVNLARGGVVDEGALYEALVNGRLAGAGLDVHVKEGEGHISPLAELDNVVLTPHMGAGTVDSQREIGEIVLAQVAEMEKNSQQSTADAIS